MASNNLVQINFRRACKNNFTEVNILPLHLISILDNSVQICRYLPVSNKNMTGHLFGFGLMG